MGAGGLGAAWDEGAEAIVEYIAEHGLATLEGEADAETVTFHVMPMPAHV